MADVGQTHTDSPADKAGFADRARRFVNWTLRLPGMPVLPAVSLAVALIGTVSGAFGTSALPMGQRLAFWLILMAIETIKWTGWLSWQVKQPTDYWRAALIGTPLLALTIPLEIALAYRAVGIDPRIEAAPVLLGAGVIGAAILLVMLVLRPPWTADQHREPNLLKKEGLSPADIHAVSSEDHYCRLFLADGSQRLLHARLSDVIDLLADQDGSRIHRSHWIADSAVRSAQRAGRGWEVIMHDGTALRVSATYRGEAQRRGWLSRGRSAS